MSTLVRSVLAGAASGARSMTGLAALALSTPARPRGSLDRALDNQWLRTLIPLAAAGELAADKLPFAPSRLEPAGLGIRVVTAAACGALLAQRSRGGGTTSTLGYALAAAATSTGSAWSGARWRSWASGRIGVDYPGALAEDVVAIALGYWAARPS